MPEKIFMEGLERIKSENEFNDLINGDIPAIIIFSAEWCGACRLFGPTALELANNCRDKIHVRVVVDPEFSDNSRLGAEQRKLSQTLFKKCDVPSIPCAITFINGKEFSRSTGAKAYTEVISSLFSNNKRDLFKSLKKSPKLVMVGLKQLLKTNEGGD